MRWFLTALLACTVPQPKDSRPTVDTGTSIATPGPADLVRERAEAEGWTVQEGAFVFSTMEFCCDAGVNCLGNNPSTPYGLVALPPGPEQTVDDVDTFWMWGPIEQPGLSRTFRMESDEIVLLVGQAPPRSKYFSLRSSIGTRYDRETGLRDMILGSVGPTTNNLTLEAQQPGFWGQTLAITSTADSASEATVETWLLETGLMPDQVHHDRISQADVNWGLDAEADTMLIAARVAVSEDPEAMDAYEANPPMRVLRLTPPPSTSTAGMAREPLPERGAGQDESQWADALDQLEASIQARFSDMIALPSPITAGFTETFTCIEAGSCIGDVRDRFAARTVDLYLDNGQAMVAYGINHERSGRATYSNFAVMVNDNWVGAAAVTSQDMVGSARAFMGDDHPQVDDLYAWILARDCSPYTEPCLEIEQDCPWPETHESFFVTFRMYLDPATGAAPLDEEMLIDRLTLFVPENP